MTKYINTLTVCLISKSVLQTEQADLFSAADFNSYGFQGGTTILPSTTNLLFTLFSTTEINECNIRFKE